MHLRIADEVLAKLQTCPRPRFTVSEDYAPAFVLGDETIDLDFGQQTLRWEKLCAMGFRTYHCIEDGCIVVRFKMSGGTVCHEPFSRRDHGPVLGIDQNSFCWALALVDPNTGNLLDYGIIPVTDNHHEAFARLGEWLARRRLGTRGERLQVAIEHLSGTAIPISASLSKRLHRFGTYRGWDMRYVDPRYTSFIGELKYGRLARRPDTASGNWQGHEAAAYVIARRALGIEEAIPSWLLPQFPSLADQAGEKHAAVLRDWKRRTKHQVWAALYAVRDQITQPNEINFVTANVPSGTRPESVKHLIADSSRLVRP